MVVPRAMLAPAAVLRVVWRATLPLGLVLAVANTGCGSRREPSGPPIGQTRAEGIIAREFVVPSTEEPSSGEEVVAPSRQELNLLAAEREEARQSEWARAALAEVASPNNDLGVVVVVAQRASDLPWLLAIQNRGERPVSVAALPELLTFEVVPKERVAEAGAAPATTPTANRWAKTPPPPPPIVCGEVPKTVAAENRVTLLPAEILVYPFDPRSYCESSDVLARGATIKPRYGFPIETKKVWRKGKLVEEVTPAKAPLAFELAPSSLPAAVPAGDEPTGTETSGNSSETAGGPATSTDTPPPVVQLKHVEANAFVLDETYPLEVITPLGRIESPEAQAAAAAATTPPTAAPGEGESESESEADSEELAPPRPPPPPPLTLTIRPLGTTSAPGSSTVTVTAKNTSGSSMRLYLRRELISYQVTGPSGPTTCRMTSSARAPSPAAYSSLAAGAALSLTTRLAEACPKGTFDQPGSYTVFARIDAQNNGREHGFVAFTGTAITGQPATLTVRGTGAQAKPVMRITSGR